MAKVSAAVIRKVYLAHLLYKRRHRRDRSAYIRNLFANKDILGGKQLVDDLKKDPLYHHRYFRLVTMQI